MAVRDGTVKLSIIVPCYNEEAVIGSTYQDLIKVLGGRKDIILELVFVDDGSFDKTFPILKSKLKSGIDMRIIKLSRNFGHQMAVTAGLENATGDVMAVMDSDLQDPPEVILRMIEEWRAGFDVVYGVRSHREGSILIKIAYKIFYRLLRKISSIDMPLDSGDFCVMDRQVVRELNALPENSRYIRGLRAWLGFRQKPVFYNRPARFAGDSKYTILDLFRLATDGIINFSIFPLSIIAVLGLATSVLSVIGAIFYFIMWLTDFSLLGGATKNVTGFTSIILGVFIFGGLQLFSLGIIGQYLGRMYIEVKRRPSYIVEKIVGREDNTPAGTV